LPPPSGISEMSYHFKEFYIYPVPANDRLYIKRNCNDCAPVYAAIFNSEMKQVISFLLIKGMNSVDISMLNNGMYFINASINGKQITKKFVFMN